MLVISSYFVVFIRHTLKTATQLVLSSSFHVNLWRHQDFYSGGLRWTPAAWSRMRLLHGNSELLPVDILYIIFSCVLDTGNYASYFQVRMHNTSSPVFLNLLASVRRIKLGWYWETMFASIQLPLVCVLESLRRHLSLGNILIYMFSRYWSQQSCYYRPPCCR